MYGNTKILKRGLTSGLKEQLIYPSSVPELRFGPYTDQFCFSCMYDVCVPLFRNVKRNFRSALRKANRKTLKSTFFEQKLVNMSELSARRFNDKYEVKIVVRERARNEDRSRVFKKPYGVVKPSCNRVSASVNDVLVTVAKKPRKSGGFKIPKTPTPSRTSTLEMSDNLSASIDRVARNVTTDVEAVLPFDKIEPGPSVEVPKRSKKEKKTESVEQTNERIAKYAKIINRVVERYSLTPEPDVGTPKPDVGTSKPDVGTPKIGASVVKATVPSQQRVPANLPKPNLTERVVFAMEHRGRAPNLNDLKGNIPEKRTILVRQTFEKPRVPSTTQATNNLNVEVLMRQLEGHVTRRRLREELAKPTRFVREGINTTAGANTVSFREPISKPRVRFDRDLYTPKKPVSTSGVKEIPSSAAKKSTTPGKTSPLNKATVVLPEEPQNRAYNLETVAELNKSEDLFAATSIAKASNVETITKPETSKTARKSSAKPSSKLSNKSHDLAKSSVPREKVAKLPPQSVTNAETKSGGALVPTEIRHVEEGARTADQILKRLPRARKSTNISSLVKFSPHSPNLPVIVNVQAIPMGLYENQNTPSRLSGTERQIDEDNDVEILGQYPNAHFPQDHEQWSKKRHYSIPVINLESDYESEIESIGGDTLSLSDNLVLDEEGPDEVANPTAEMLSGGYGAQSRPIDYSKVYYRMGSTLGGLRMPVKDYLKIKGTRLKEFSVPVRDFSKDSYP